MSLENDVKRLKMEKAILISVLDEIAGLIDDVDFVLNKKDYYIKPKHMREIVYCKDLCRYAMVQVDK